ncbi:hypothetical protein AYI70_g8659 [Smittium culicis]|uniref:Uncharacterized protein n=1 Tax=Smittium culicis TaxID=133412 RepID=A0A1R1XF24_9FUNG|nr:hypothetical protein AYI70_g8659 [Smittium culicis]
MMKYPNCRNFSQAAFNNGGAEYRKYTHSVIIPNWKLSPDKLRRSINILSKNKRNVINADNMIPDNNEAITLKRDHLILVPVTKTQNIKFFKNFYSEYNIRFFCDSNDDRNECDYRSKYTYNTKTLVLKTKHMFDVVCNSDTRYKTYAKMNFDTIIDKNYMNGILKLASDNSDKLFFFGAFNSLFNSQYKNGRFYGLTDSLLRLYCSHKNNVPLHFSDDIWFGNVINHIHERLISTAKNGVTLLSMNKNKIHHTSYIDAGIQFRLDKQ